MGRRLRPAGSGLAGGLDGVADVLAVALPHLADQAPVRTQDLAAGLAVRAGLLAADVQLGRAVDGRQTGRNAVVPVVLFVLEVLVVLAVLDVLLLGLGLPARLHVLPEPFPAALAAEAAL